MRDPLRPRSLGPREDANVVPGFYTDAQELGLLREGAAKRARDAFLWEHITALHAHYADRP